MGFIQYLNEKNNIKLPKEFKQHEKYVNGVLDVLTKMGFTNYCEPDDSFGYEDYYIETPDGNSVEIRNASIKVLIDFNTGVYLFTGNEFDCGNAQNSFYSVVGNVEKSKEIINKIKKDAVKILTQYAKFQNELCSDLNLKIKGKTIKVVYESNGGEIDIGDEVEYGVGDIELAITPKGYVIKKVMLWNEDYEYMEKLIKLNVNIGSCLPPEYWPDLIKQGLK